MRIKRNEILRYLEEFSGTIELKTVYVCVIKKECEADNRESLIKQMEKIVKRVKSIAEDEVFRLIVVNNETYVFYAAGSENFKEELLKKYEGEVQGDFLLFELAESDALVSDIIHFYSTPRLLLKVE